jgi:hypothetical protein
MYLILYSARTRFMILAFQLNFQTDTWQINERRRHVLRLFSYSPHFASSLRSHVFLIWGYLFYTQLRPTFKMLRNSFCLSARIIVEFGKKILLLPSEISVYRVRETRWRSEILCDPFNSRLSWFNCLTFILKALLYTVSIWCSYVERILAVMSPNFPGYALIQNIYSTFLFQSFMILLLRWMGKLRGIYPVWDILF